MHTCLSWYDPGALQTAKIIMKYEYESVVQLCQELGICRMTFYRWDMMCPLTETRMNTPLSYFKVTRPQVFNWLMNEIYPATHRYPIAVMAERFELRFNLGTQSI